MASITRKSDRELLEIIHESAIMGINSLDTLIPKIKEQQLINKLCDYKKEYHELALHAGELLAEEGIAAEDAAYMKKTMLKCGIHAETITDRSANHIAEMLIKGSANGITAVTARLNAYEGEKREAYKLAKTYITEEQARIEDMKGYLCK